MTKKRLHDSGSRLRTARYWIGRAFRRFGHVVKVLARQPLVQFLALGALIFVVSRFAEDRADKSSREILITGGTESHLSDLYRNQFGAAPDPAALEELTRNYIDDEVLYREGLRLGLDRNDEIVRQRLVQKMRFLLSGRAAIPSPDEKTLREFYLAHMREYATPATVSFRQIYFETDEADAARPPRRALQRLADLQSGRTAPQPMEHRSPVNESYSSLTPDEAGRVFGDTPFVGELFAASVGQWSGPVRSGYGWHLIYVSERTKEESPALEAVRNDVVELWRQAAHKSQDEQALRELKDKYKIIREPAVTPK